MTVTMPQARPTSPSQRPIVVVDDDAKIVALLRTYLEREGFSVIPAHDGRAALKAIRDHDPALIVLDLMLPELDGLAVQRQVRETSDTPILMLSARSTVADRIRGIEEGADDYLPKPFSPAELVVRVKALLRRSAPPADYLVADDRPTLEHADLRIDTRRYEVRRGDELLPLTLVEFRLLSALVAADGRVLTRDQLLDAVYGLDDVDIMDRTIDVHVGRLRDKLGDDAERPRYVATVRGVGYRAAPADRGAAASEAPLSV
ncbi:response regulator transcription factor [soil metagenome]